METTQPNSVLPYTQLRSRQPKRINVRLIVFLVLVVGFAVTVIGMKVSSDLHAGIRHNGDVALVDLKALGFFPFDQNTGTINEVPKVWRGLDGKKVELEGFMFAPQSAANQLSEFQFVYNVQKCCFSGPPQVQERVFARVPRGHEVPYFSDFCKVSGTLHVGVKKVDGVIISIYTLDVDKTEADN